jgi:hypothetical protein
MTSSIPLSVALRYFAGGCTNDLAVMHGNAWYFIIMKFTRVLMVLRAFNSCDQLILWQRQEQISLLVAISGNGLSVTVNFVVA